MYTIVIIGIVIGIIIMDLFTVSIAALVCSPKSKEQRMRDDEEQAEYLRQLSLKKQSKGVKKKHEDSDNQTQ